MRVTRPTLPTIAVSVAFAALVVGVTISSVESHHGGSSDSALQPTPGQTITPAQQLAIAHNLTKIALPKGAAHTKVCPQLAPQATACFFSSLSGPVPSALTAAGDTESFLAAIAVSDVQTRGCTNLIGDPQRSGYECTAGGTWRGATVSATVFVSNVAHKTPARRGINAMVSVQTS